ncbi:MAG: hypothetical protein A2W90_07105 [Bacteroidetes bacterium GWF2_42_66]|nr:MAG: hypothetical protein A2W92_01555 [Bacteroidetes bacterium GWA2_42_15]OFY02908.1 MAG: hypothetical protein A2W89_24510 [Bacteroidetes bacterium GWE2_42_39]OFY44563.1 MAG: hypothetical protein A2W90_07105 [Bacteroidetes bacterium GWF2_42_66]HBL74878.1 hypothetical protein [Prolixibacteraceae bacterium]HCR91727.1 hypothetical protein [Prolixibacteraceae bacterium]
MKISRIIFISFFSVFTLFMLSLTIQTEDRGKKMFDEMKQEKIALPAFSHLVIKDRCNVQLQYSPADTLKIGYFRGLILEKPIYTVVGDTLIIEPFPEQNGFYTNLSCSNLKSISIAHARLDISDYKCFKLKIDEMASTIYMNSSSSLDTLIMHCIDSNYRIDTKGLKSVQVLLKKSRGEFYGGMIEEMKAELLDTSQLSTNKVLLTSIKADESSRYFSR